MWLLGSTAEGDRKGIAEFFQTPLQVAMAGGSGSGDSSSVIQGGGEDLIAQHGPGAAGRTRRGAADDQPAGGARRARAARSRAARELKRRFEEAIESNEKLSQFKNQIRLEITRRRPAGHGHRRAEPRDVRHRRRGAEGLHARHHARDRRAAERRRQRDFAGRPHGCHAIRRRRAGLLELGAFGRSRQRVAPRARRGRHAREQDPACRRAWARRCRSMSTIR